LPSEPTSDTISSERPQKAWRGSKFRSLTMSMPELKSRVGGSGDGGGGDGGGGGCGDMIDGMFQLIS
jgi:hypothetical protein